MIYTCETKPSMTYFEISIYTTGSYMREKQYVKSVNIVGIGFAMGIPLKNFV